MHNMSNEGLNGYWHHFSSTNSPLPLDSLVVSCAANKHHAKIWMNVWISLGIGVAAQPWGLILTDGKTWSEFKLGEFNLPTGTIQAMAVDRNAGIWLSFLNEGICYFDGQSAKVFEYEKTGVSIGELVVTDLHIGNSYEILMATLTSGVYKFSGTHWERDINYAEVDKSQRILAFSQDQAANIWLACEESDNTKFFAKKVDNWGKFYSIPIGLKHSDQVTCFIVDHNDEIWVGSKAGGLWVRNGKDWKRLTEHDCPLLYGEIRSLNIDEFNNLWVGTPGGFAIFDGMNWHEFGAIVPNSSQRPLRRKDLLQNTSLSQSDYIYVGDYMIIDGSRRKWLSAPSGVVMFSSQAKTLE